MTNMNSTFAGHTGPTPLRPTCPMPYHPSPGVNLVQHDQDAGCRFYVVTKGRIPGAHTDTEVAHNQVTRFGAGFQKGFDHYDDVLAYWKTNCSNTHGDICPDADPAEVAAAAAAMLDCAFPNGPTTAAPASSYALSYTACAGSRAAAAPGPSSPNPTRTPVTMATRVHLLSPVKTAPAKFWGCAGIHRTFDSHGEALAAAFGKGIDNPHVWGHANKNIVEDFVRSIE